MQNNYNCGMYNIQLTKQQLAWTTDLKYNWWVQTFIIIIIIIIIIKL